MTVALEPFLSQAPPSQLGQPRPGVGGTEVARPAIDKCASEDRGRWTQSCEL